VATVRLAPDAVQVQVALTGAVAAVQDDPDAADASWLTYNAAVNDNTDCRVSFPSSPGPLSAGSGLQEFRARVRKTATSGNVTTYSLQLWEGGVQRAVLGTGTVTATNPGVVLAGTWDAATLADPSGAGVECRVQQTGGGANGGGSSRRRIEVGAVEWNATYSTTVAVAPASATHGHTATAPSLTQTHAVSPGSGSHAHTATEPVVTAVGGSAVVTPASAGHAHAATAPAVSQRHAVAPASATHTHAAGSPPLSQTRSDRSRPITPTQPAARR
jgi:hypothetical protein